MADLQRAAWIRRSEDTKQITYTCHQCGKRFKTNPDNMVACAVMHYGGCCHYTDTALSDLPLKDSKPSTGSKDAPKGLEGIKG